MMNMNVAHGGLVNDWNPGREEEMQYKGDKNFKRRQIVDVEEEDDIKGKVKMMRGEKQSIPGEGKRHSTQSRSGWREDGF